ncbi:MAG: IS200/IS605 family transposase [Candidatus Sumerlaeia bacterium]
MSWTQIYYHIVFSTKNRIPCLDKENRVRLFHYIWGVIKNKHCHLYRINGLDDHLHIFTSLHPSVCLADLVKGIKVSSSLWIKENKIFPAFEGWQDQYAAFTHSDKEKHRIIEYIKNQEEHHRKLSYFDELRSLMKEAGLEFDERFLK